MVNKKDLFPIGIGTWGIGGFIEKDSNVNEKRQLDAISYIFNKGCNFVEANMWYSGGYSVDILAKALVNSEKSRDHIFICQAIYLKDGKGFEISKDELNKTLDLFSTNYIDTLQFSAESFSKSSFEDICAWIDELIANNTIRYVSITNAGIDLLEKYYEKYKDKLFSHELCFNFEIRENLDYGIIPFAEENQILNVIFQPLRRNRTANRNWPLLVELAKKYGKTQNQIILNWTISQGFLPLVKSETKSHIDENLDSLNFKLEPEDIKRLDDFRPPNYISPKIDWEGNGDGVRIDQLSNVFDERCK